MVEVLAAVYPGAVFNDPQTWPRARRLDALALALVGAGEPPGTDEPATRLLNRLASYRHGALAAYAQARPLYERALAIREKALGPAHPDTAQSLNNLARVLQAQGDLAAARPLYERALAIVRRRSAPTIPLTATSLNNLAVCFSTRATSPRRGRSTSARWRSGRRRSAPTTRYGGEPQQPRRAASGPGRPRRGAAALERALAIHEKVLGPDHPYTATSLNNLAGLLQDQGDLAAGAAAL